MRNINDLEMAISNLDDEIASLGGTLSSVEAEFRYVEDDFKELTDELNGYRALGFVDADELKVQLKSCDTLKMEHMETTVRDFNIANKALRATNLRLQAALDEINTITADELTGGDAPDFIDHPDGVIQDVRDGQ